MIAGLALIRSKSVSAESEGDKLTSDRSGTIKQSLSFSSNDNSLLDFSTNRSRMFLIGVTHFPVTININPHYVYQQQFLL